MAFAVALTHQYGPTVDSAVKVFGYAVDLAAGGETLAVGGDEGMYVYGRGTTAWEPQTSLAPWTAAVMGYDWVARAVALDGATFTRGAVADSADDSGDGLAYTVTATAGLGVWNTNTNAGFNAAAPGTAFGSALALNNTGDRLVAGMSGYLPPEEPAATMGAVFTYRWDAVDQTWVQVGDVRCYDDWQDDVVEGVGAAAFGAGVALNSYGEIMAVGAPDVARVFTFDWDEDRKTWTQRAQVIAAPSLCVASFGMSVALSGNGRRLAVGGYRYYDGGERAGAVWIYDLIAGQWTISQMVTGDRAIADEKADPGEFGAACALSDDGRWLVVGEPGRLDGVTVKGAIHTFTDALYMGGDALDVGFARYDHPPRPAYSQTTVALEMANKTTGWLEYGVTDPVIALSKNGAAFAPCSLGSWTEVGHGVYYVTLDAQDTNAPGWAIVRVKAPISPETHVLVEIGVEADAGGVRLGGGDPPWLAYRQKDQQVAFQLVDPATGGGATGIGAATVELAKNGNPFAAMEDGTFAEIGNGWYSVTFGIGDTDAMGWAVLRVVAADQRAAEAHILVEVSIKPSEKRRDHIRERADHRGVQ